MESRVPITNRFIAASIAVTATDPFTSHDPHYLYTPYYHPQWLVVDTHAFGQRMKLLIHAIFLGLRCRRR
jgi:hypothetical protein